MSFNRDIFQIEGSFYELGSRSFFCATSAD